jgi:hypothetical protein
MMSVLGVYLMSLVACLIVFAIGIAVLKLFGLIE